MKLKDKILLLFKREENAISGSALAKECGVSRNAIWLAIQELRKDGYKIISKKNVGYTLQTNFASITESEIRQNFENDSHLFSFILLDTVDSTNTYMKQNAHMLQTWTVVLAEEQTAGRGRLHRTFSSPKYAGVYMSILLRPQIALQLLPRITVCAAVAICRGIEKLTTQKPQIKWVNDIFLAGKKVAGILTESVMQVEHEILDFVVVGIGINFHKKAIDENLQHIVTALFDSEDFKSDLRAKFIAYFLEEFYLAMENLQANTFFNAYKDRLFILGQIVQVSLASTSFLAKVKDINENYNLLVVLENGQEKLLTAGEVSIQPSLCTCVANKFKIRY